MKTALVMTGLPRDFERAYPAIKSRILERYQISAEDIYIHTWSNRGYWVPGDSARHESFFPADEVSEKMVRSTYPKSNVVVENFEQKYDFLKSNLDYLPEVFLPSLKHSNYVVRGINLVSMLYEFSSGLTLAMEGGDYDAIVRTRPDIFPTNRLPTISSGKLLIAKQSNHFGNGVGDNLHIGPADLHLPIRKMFENLPELFRRSKGILCPHVLTQVALEHSRVNFSQKRLPFRTLHTPAGMYQVLDEERGTWEPLHKAEYHRKKGPFSGKPPNSTN